MERIVVAHEDFDLTLAQMFVRQVLKKPDSTLCFATGDTTKGVFPHLVRLKEALGVDFSRVKACNLDEYVGVAKEDPASCYWRIRHDLYGPLGLREEQFFVPSCDAAGAEAECAHFQRVLEGYGGIDLMLLSVGGNGHIAFNEPGTPFGTGIHVVDITDSTVQAKAAMFGGAEKVPRQGITMGVRSIMMARKIVLAACGAHKAGIIRQGLEGPVTEAVPLSVLQLHRDTLAVLDSAAAAELDGG